MIEQGEGLVKLSLFLPIIWAKHPLVGYWTLVLSNAVGLRLINKTRVNVAEDISRRQRGRFRLGHRN